jgi:hypothetical protein
MTNSKEVTESYKSIKSVYFFAERVFMAIAASRLPENPKRKWVNQGDNTPFIREGYGKPLMREITPLLSGISEKLSPPERATYHSLEVYLPGDEISRSITNPRSR